jgi:GNAT superfamily N-acetyltransferase
MVEIIIRELQPEQDLDRWLRLVWAVEVKKTGSASRTKDQLRRMLEWPRTKRWVAEAPGDPETLIGQAFLFAQIKERSALDITVHPDWQGRGVGSRLLAFLMQEAQKLGAQ